MFDRVIKNPQTESNRLIQNWKTKQDKATTHLGISTDLTIQTAIRKKQVK